MSSQDPPADNTSTADFPEGSDGRQQSPMRSRQWEDVVQRCLRPIAFAWTVALLVVALPAWGQAGDECAIPRNVAAVRPDDDGPPTPVMVGLFVVDVIKIDESTESFTVDFVLTARWQDPRLSATERGESLEDCVLDLERVWHPSIALVNQRRIWPREKDHVRVDAEGNVSFSRRLYGEMSATYELRHFPFDEQRLPFELFSHYGPEEVALQGDPTTTGRWQKALLAGWELVDIDDAPQIEHRQVMGQDFTLMQFALQAERSFGYYFWKIFVPLTLIVAMASIVFWIDPQNFGPQLGVSTASVFTLIAFMLSLGRLMPRISYLTSLDLFVYGSVLLVFAALAESVVSTRLAQKSQGERAIQIDRHARWIYWSIFGLILLVVVTF